MAATQVDVRLIAPTTNSQISSFKTLQDTQLTEYYLTTKIVDSSWQIKEPQRKTWIKMSKLLTGAKLALSWWVQLA